MDGDATFVQRLARSLADAAVPTASGQQDIAIFDFDGTLIYGDSLLPFLELAVGRTRARFALVQSVCTAPLLRSAGTQDLRTKIKSGLLERALAGVPLSQAQAAAEALVPCLRWRQDIRDILIAHARAGCRILVATGALSLYMPQLLAGLPVDDLLATEIACQDGILTGQMVSGNCVRAAKAERVRDYLDKYGPFGIRWGYGNRPSDLPMLALVDCPTVIVPD